MEHNIQGCYANAVCLNQRLHLQKFFTYGQVTAFLVIVSVCMCFTLIDLVLTVLSTYIMVVHIAKRSHSGAVATDSPPTCDVSGSNPGSYVGKLVVAY